MAQHVGVNLTTTLSSWPAYWIDLELADSGLPIIPFYDPSPVLEALVVSNILLQSQYKLTVKLGAAP